MENQALFHIPPDGTLMYWLLAMRLWNEEGVKGEEREHVRLVEGASEWAPSLCGIVSGTFWQGAKLGGRAGGIMLRPRDVDDALLYRASQILGHSRYLVIHCSDSE